MSLPHTESPRQSNLIVPLCHFLMSYLLLRPLHSGFYFHYSLKRALAETANDLQFAKSNALFLELSLFGTIAQFDTVDFVFVLELSVYYWVWGPPHCPDFPPPP